MGKAAKPEAKNSVLQDHALNVTSAYVQTLAVGLETGDALPTIILHMDHQRLAFNCGEGFQRCCNEHKVCSSACRPGSTKARELGKKVLSAPI